MRYARIRFFLLAGITLLAAVSCAGVGPVKESDLEGRRFVLVRVNGVPFESGFFIPDIEFGENLHVSGQVCNRYMGRGRLAGNVLTVSPMASTRMLCPDESLDKLERNFSEMMRSGAEISFSGDGLTLAGNGWTFVYKEKARTR